MNLHTRTHPRTLSLTVRTIHHSASSAPASALSTKQPPSTPAGQQRNGVRSSLFRSSLCSVQFNSIQFSSVQFRFGSRLTVQHPATSTIPTSQILCRYVQRPLPQYLHPLVPPCNPPPSLACAAPSVFIALLCAQFVVKICCQKEKYIS